MDLVESVAKGARFAWVSEPLSGEGGSYASADGSWQQAPLPPELHVAAAARLSSYQAGRHAAVLALGRLGLPALAPGYCPVERLPLWPAGIQGSITHTTGMVGGLSGVRHQVAGAVVRRLPEPSQGSTFLAHAGTVGLDVERVMDTERAGRLRARILGDGDEAHVFAGYEPNLAVTLVFSAKEAVYKSAFLGCGVRCSLADLAVRACREVSGPAHLVALRDLACVEAMGSLDLCFAGQHARLNDTITIKVFFWLRLGLIWTLARLEPHAS